MNVTFEIVKNSPEIRTYITQADASLTALGFTEHSFAHVTKCAEVAARILTQLGYSPKEVELAKIAAFMHDIGNVVNRATTTPSAEPPWLSASWTRWGWSPPMWPRSSPPSAITTTPPPFR